MPLTITKKYQYVEYLGLSKPINQLGSRPSIRAIIGISDDGLGYVSWESESTLNSLTALTTFTGYLVISQETTPNYVLYSEADAVSTNTTTNPITQNLTIAKYKSTSPTNINNLLIKDNIKQIYGVSSDGLNPISWSNDSRLNSLTTLNNDTSYLIVAETLPFDFWSQVPPTPTPTQSPTATPTLTPGLVPSTTPTNTPTNTPTPTSTPLPPDQNFSVVFDQPVYYIDSVSNHNQEYSLISATIIGQPNTAYSYNFTIESDNGTLVFDNGNGLLALEEINGVLFGKIFTNVRVNSPNGQTIVRCSVTDTSVNKTVDALAVILVNPIMGVPTPTPTLTPSVTPTRISG